MKEEWISCTAGEPFGAPSLGTVRAINWLTTSLNLQTQKIDSKGTEGKAISYDKKI